MMTLRETYYVVRAKAVKWLRKVTGNRDMLPSNFTNLGHWGVPQVAETIALCEKNEVSIKKHNIFNANYMYFLFVSSMHKSSDQIAVYLWDYDDTMDICCLYRGRYKYFYRAYLPTKRKLRVFAVIRDEDVTKIFVTDIEHSKRLKAFLKEEE